MQPATREWRFFVAGVPIQQGSSRAFLDKQGRPFITSDTRRNLKFWRDTVHTGATQHFEALLQGPVGLQVEFILPRPQSTPRRLRRPWHTKKPDADKLIRAVFDALRGVAYKDDAQVARFYVSKVVAAEGEQTGARIVVRDLSEESL